MSRVNTNRCIVLGRPDCLISEPKRVPKLFDQSWPGEVTHMRRWLNQDVADITIIANLAALKPYKYANVWLEMVLQDRRTFFYNPVENISLWDRLEALMPDTAGSWQMFTKAGGINVWHNAREKKTTTTSPFARDSRRQRQQGRRSRGSNQGPTELLKVSDVIREMFLNAMRRAKLPAHMDRAYLTRHYPVLSQTLFMPSDTMSYEQFELHVLIGLDPFLSSDSRHADCRANILLAMIKSTEAIGVSDRSQALFLAWDEHVSSSSSFKKRRAYIKFLWKDWEENAGQIGNVWECPEWPHMLTPKQRREFQDITREVALALEELRTQGEEIDHVHKAISRVFPTYSPNDPRPLQLPKARGGNHMADMEIVDSDSENEVDDEDVDILLEGGIGGEEDELSDPEVEGNDAIGDESESEGSQMTDSENEVSESDSDEDPYDVDGTSTLVRAATRLR